MQVFPGNQEKEVPGAPNKYELPSLKSGTHDAATKSNAIEIPQITLPKGGGALKGIDEKFQVNPSNGTASFSIPLPLTTGRGGFTPSLSLSYNSGAGNSLLGIGWDLGYPSIQRKTDKKLPRYRDFEDSDTFMFSGVEDLVPMLKANGNAWSEDKFDSPDGVYAIRRYRPRIEGSFSRIERIWKKGAPSFYWKVTTRDNTVTFFGKSATHRIADPADASRVFQWLPELSFDDKGNCMLFHFKDEDLALVSHDVHEANRHKTPLPFVNRYLKRVYYGNKTAFYPGYVANATDFDAIYNTPNPAVADFLFELVFDYGEHKPATPPTAASPSSTPAGDWEGAVTVFHDDPLLPPRLWPARTDAFSNYRPGFEVRTYRLCRRVLMFHHFQELNEVDNTSTDPSPCLVRSLDFEYRQWANGTQAPEEHKLEMTYLDKITQRGYIRSSQNGYRYKSLPPMSFEYQELAWNKVIQNVTPENLANAPAGLTSGYQFTDFYGEGIPGILTEQGEAWHYKENQGNGRFTIAKPVMSKPSFTGLANGTLQLQDLEADGRKQIVVNSPGLQGYFELDDENRWEPFRAFARTANIDLRDPNTRMLDLNGDGQPDILISEENVFCWYPAAGTKGYDSPELAHKPFDEERGPAIVFADPTQSIFLADMSGDGLTDIVRIRNGEICYWPNLGYGRFGAKVNMSDAPRFDTPDQFNPAYLQLADISGTGLTDIIYLGKNQFRAWLNLSGNGWSKGTGIEAFPQTAQPGQISVTDLLGNGTSCIVWSSPLPAHAQAPMRYIDLMSGVKPHIMTAYHNGMGKTTTFTYKSSTHFYLKDKAVGKPWITKLPFPVQCVDKVVVEDEVADLKFTNTYEYHHGYYDHAEREFRGFGRVDQTDTEDYDRATPGLDATFFQAPVLTKTWFHTGAFVRQDLILRQFAGEYYTGGPDYRLPDARIESDAHALSPDEYREALRACKGMTLRQEVYALDDKPESAHPYTVAEHNCHVTLLQPRQKNTYAVFLPKESESLTCHLERNPEDPRIAHTLNLEFDDQGNPLKSVAAVYARRVFPADLPAAARAAQEKSHLVFTEAAFTQDILGNTAYRLRVPYFTKTWELRGFEPAARGYFTLNDFEDLLPENTPAVEKLAYEAPFTAGKQKRLIEHIKTLYRKDDLSGPLPEGEHGALGLSWEAYQLAYTPGLLADVYGAKLLPAEWPQKLETLGRYEQIDGENWWISSGKMLLPETMAQARKQFFLPDGYEDPFEVVTKVRYETTYYLFITETEDALGNIVSVEKFDYRTLSPLRIKDINDNETEAITDDLGLMVATAIRGKNQPGGGSESGDNLENYAVELTKAQSAAFWADPKTQAAGILRKATVRMVYDFSTQPVRVATIARETHGDPNTKTQVSLEYTSGMGQSLLKKVQAEPGMAKRLNADGTADDVEADPRWVGTGRTILNNKGNPVKQYEPYFSVTHAYESEAAVRELGVTPVLHYDPIGRVIRTDLPDGTFTRVEFTPWEQRVFDQNDTVLEQGNRWYIERMTLPAGHEQKKAAQKAALHADTPTVIHTDTFGRPFLSIADNGAAGKYATYVELDIEGNQRSVTDARGNVVMAWKYDMLGHQVYQDSMDGGERWMLHDCMGKPVRKWDSKGQVFETEYDALHRPVHNKVNGAVFEVIIYGTAADKHTNCNGQVIEHRDTAGVLKNTDFNFKGNLLRNSRQLLADAKSLPDWNAAPGLMDEVFESETTYDALNRPVEMTAPQIDGKSKSKIRMEYNEAGLLNRVSADVREQGYQLYVSNIDYDAKGQRTEIVYGNNTRTKYWYDEKTFRLTVLITTKDVDPAVFLDKQELAAQSDKCFQYLQYTYDPVGNITDLRDDAHETIYFANAVVEPHAAYTYDAIYRLIEATGREHEGIAGRGNKYSDQFDAARMIKGNIPNPNNPNEIIRYTEIYHYDEVGNMLEVKHQAGQGNHTNNWTKTFEYNTNAADRDKHPWTAGKPLNNQLLGMKAGNGVADSFAYTYDAHGNMEGIGGGYNFTWDALDRLQNISLPNNETVDYQYDGSGERTRKTILRADGTIKEERLYLGGFELYREYHANGNVTLERESLHIMDDTRRIALVETKTVGGATPKSPDLINETVVRYQYSNHLGSGCVELDDAARVISYEEYHPYGTTAFQLTNAAIKAAAKRYRYTGMERDEESGLNYHSARYYAGWLGRWVSCDPIKAINLYLYGNNNPVNFKDIDGRAPKCEGQAGCDLTFIQWLEISRKRFSVNSTDLEAATEIQKQADQYRESNFENSQLQASQKENEEPTALARAWEVARSKTADVYLALKEKVTNTFLAKKYTEGVESIKNAGSDIGSEVLTNMNPYQRGSSSSDPMAQEVAASSSINARKLGREIGAEVTEASISIAEAVAVDKGLGVVLRGAEGLAMVTTRIRKGLTFEIGGTKAAFQAVKKLDNFIYRLYNGAGEVIYVGKSNDPIERLAQHLGDKPWFGEISRLEVMQGGLSDIEAHALEQDLIQQALTNGAKLFNKDLTPFNKMYPQGELAPNLPLSGGTPQNFSVTLKLK